MVGSSPTCSGKPPLPSVTQVTVTRPGNNFCPSHSTESTPDPACDCCPCPLPQTPAKCHSHTLHDAQMGKGTPPLAPTGGLCLLGVSPLQCHHFKGGHTQRRAVTQGNTGGRVSRAWPGSVTPENTRYRSTQHSCCGHRDFCQGIQLLMEWLASNPNSPPHSM